MEREKKEGKRIHHLGRQKTKSADSGLQSISVDWASDIPSFSSGRPHASDRIFFLRRSSEWRQKPCQTPSGRLWLFDGAPGGGGKAMAGISAAQPPCQPPPDLIASIVSNAKNGALLCADTV